MAQRLTTRSDWLASHPPAPGRLTQTLAGVAQRARSDEGFHPAVREFLDEFALRGDERSRSAAIADAWLNDAVKGFLAGPDPAAAPVLDLPGLRCLAASPQTLLALKVLAHRVGGDEADLRLLASELGLESAKDVLEVAEGTFGDRLDPAARFFVEQIFESDSWETVL